MQCFKFKRIFILARKNNLTSNSVNKIEISGKKIILCPKAQLIPTISWESKPRIVLQQQYDWDILRDSKCLKIQGILFNMSFGNHKIPFVVNKIHDTARKISFGEFQNSCAIHLKFHFYYDKVNHSKIHSSVRKKLLTWLQPPSLFYYSFLLCQLLCVLLAAAPSLLYVQIFTFLIHFHFTLDFLFCMYLFILFSMPARFPSDFFLFVKILFSFLHWHEISARFSCPHFFFPRLSERNGKHTRPKSVSYEGYRV